MLVFVQGLGAASYEVGNMSMTLGVPRVIVSRVEISISLILYSVNYEYVTCYPLS